MYRLIYQEMLSKHFWVFLNRHFPSKAAGPFFPLLQISVFLERYVIGRSASCRL